MGITRLDSECPLYFKIIPGYSNANEFVKFVRDWISLIKPGDFIRGDNLSYHVKGWSGKFANTVVELLGGKYFRLPAYSPEFNPIGS
jgi:hypothetical protein